MRRGAILALFLTALFIAGCGGGGEQTTSPSTAAELPQGTTPTPQGEAKAGEGSEESAPSSEHQRQVKNPPIASTRTPRQKAVAPGVPTSKGSDNSIQVFGVEGETDDAGQATANLRAYLSARAREDWPAACAEASAELKEQLATLVERAKTKEGTDKPEGCAETLALFFGKAPPVALQEAAQVDRVLSFRVREDGYAYLIYESKDEVKFIAMAEDDGQWKVNVVEPQAFETSQGESN